MPQQFSNPAIHIIRLAQEEAKRQGTTVVGTEHLLLGLLREEEGGAARVLRRAGLKVEEVRRALTGNDLPSDGEAEIQSTRMVLSPKGKSALEFSLEAARDLNPKFGLLNIVTTEHVLLGLLRVGPVCRGVCLLQTLAIDLDKIRHEVVRELTSRIAVNQ